MPKPFLHAAVTASLVAGVLVLGAGPAAAEEYSIYLPWLPGNDQCVDVTLYPDRNQQPEFSVCP
jgi:uncharacterized membrane protein YesL